MTPEEAGYVRSMKPRMCQTCEYFQAPNTCNSPLSIPVDPVLDCCNHWDPREKESGDIIYLGAVKNAKTLNNNNTQNKPMNCKITKIRTRLASLESNLTPDKRLLILKARLDRILKASDFTEEDHPRDGGGQFTCKDCNSKHSTKSDLSEHGDMEHKKHIPIKKDISDIDKGNASDSFRALEDKYMKDIEKEYGNDFGVSHSEYSKPAEVRGDQINDYLSRYHQDELNALHSKYHGTVSGNIGNVGYGNLSILDPRLGESVPDEHKLEEVKRVYDKSLGAEGRDRLFKNILPHRRPEPLSDKDFQQHSKPTQNLIRKGIELGLHKKWNWNTVSDDMRNSIANRLYDDDKTKAEAVSKKDIDKLSPSELHKINDLISSNMSFQSDSKLRPIQRNWKPK